MNVAAPDSNRDKQAQATSTKTPGPAADLQSADINQAQAIANPLVPAGLLEPAEIVLMVVKPSAWMILFDSLRALLIVASLTFLAVRLLPVRYESIEPQQVYAIAAGIMSVKLFWHFLDWVGRVYILTDRRLLVVAGVVRLTVHEKPIGQVQGLQVLNTFLERTLGLGTLGFTIQGVEQQVLWRTIGDPNPTAEQAWRHIERYSR